MAKYKILVIGLLVASNTVKKFGDIVDETELIGSPEQLVKEGYVIEATKEELAALETPAAYAPVVENTPAPVVEEEVPVVEETPEVIEEEVIVEEPVKKNPLDKLKGKK